MLTYSGYDNKPTKNCRQNAAICFAICNMQSNDAIWSIKVAITIWCRLALSLGGLKRLAVLQRADSKLIATLQLLIDVLILLSMQLNCVASCKLLIKSGRLPANIKATEEWRTLDCLIVTPRFNIICLTTIFCQIAYVFRPSKAFCFLLQYYHLLVKALD